MNCKVCGKKDHNGNFYSIKRILPGLINYGEDKRIDNVRLCENCMNRIICDLDENTYTFGKLINICLEKYGV